MREPNTLGPGALGLRLLSSVLSDHPPCLGCGVRLTSTLSRVILCLGALMVWRASRWALRRLLTGARGDVQASDCTWLTVTFLIPNPSLEG